MNHTYPSPYESYIFAFLAKNKHFETLVFPTPMKKKQIEDILIGPSPLKGLNNRNKNIFFIFVKNIIKY